MLPFPSVLHYVHVVEQPGAALAATVDLGIHYRGVKLERGAVDGGSII